MSIYSHLTHEERYQIYALMKAGLQQSEIAALLGRSPSTISRELRRKPSRRGYRPRQAHERACHRPRVARTRPPIIEPQWRAIAELLR